MQEGEQHLTGFRATKSKGGKELGCTINEMQYAAIA